MGGNRWQQTRYVSKCFKGASAGDAEATIATIRFAGGFASDVQRKETGRGPLGNTTLSGPKEKWLGCCPETSHLSVISHDFTCPSWSSDQRWHLIYPHQRLFLSSGSHVSSRFNAMLLKTRLPKKNIKEHDRVLFSLGWCGLPFGTNQMFTQVKHDQHLFAGGVCSGCYALLIMGL